MFFSINKKITAGLFVGAVSAVGLMVSFAVPAFAADPAPRIAISVVQGVGETYPSAVFNSSTSSNSTILEVNTKVVGILLGYGMGADAINSLTKALAQGIGEAEFTETLLAIGINERDIKELFTTLDELGAKIPATGVTPASTVGPSPIAVPVIEKREALEEKREGGCIAPTVTPPRPEVVDGAKKGVEIRVGVNLINTATEISLRNSKFQGEATSVIHNIKVVTPAEREGLIEELRVKRKVFQEDIRGLRQDFRNNSKELRKNFRENLEITVGRVDHLKTARIVVAHYGALRMTNRFNVAIARFDHIIVRIESRVTKLEAQGVDVSLVVPFIEEAKNMSVENEAKLGELKAKYELLLLGENSQEVAKEARQATQDLKVEIRNLHTKLREIVSNIRIVTEEEKAAQTTSIN